MNRLKKEIEEIRAGWSEDQKVIQAFYTGKGVIITGPSGHDLQEIIREAARAGRPFTLTGMNGLWERRNKDLPPMFQTVSRDKLRTQASELLRHGVIVQCAAVGQKKAQWLDVPGGPFAIGRGKFASMAEKSA
ncbi:hypothetical protein DSCA_49060 [Desulfosarcina alkanivorans]|uniref:Uncharacterized protein n=1 Tax=Desulfosarcina alkanivorans TaxID=571177 RepID=A0A5K7YP40_9BACT|nr:hypothetical protein DSCA_49060 [Desulfosarcina alkanivorans]